VRCLVVARAVQLGSRRKKGSPIETSRSSGNWRSASWRRVSCGWVSLPWSLRYVKALATATWCLGSNRRSLQLQAATALTANPMNVERCLAAGTDGIWEDPPGTKAQSVVGNLRREMQAPRARNNLISSAWRPDCCDSDILARTCLSL